MATESTTTFANFLKDFFAPGNIGEAMNDNVLLYNKIRSMGKIIPWGGAAIKFPIQDQRQAGVGAVASGASTLPTATVSNALQASFSARRVYGRGEIDDMTIEDTAGAPNDYAYVSALSKVQEDLLLTVRQAFCAWWYDDGRGRLGIMPAADNAAQVTFNQPVLIGKGYRCDIIDDGDNQTKHLDSQAVTAVSHAKDSGTSQVTFGGAASSTGAGDYATFEDFITASGGQLGPFGLLAAAHSSNPSLENYGGINRSTAGNEAWQGNVDSNSGTNRPFDPRLVNDNLELRRRRSSGSLISSLICITNHQIVNEMFEQVAPDRQIVTRGKEAMQISQGFKGGSAESMMPIAWINDNIPVHADEFAPANTMFFLDMSKMRITETGPPKLVNRDGNVLHMFEDRPAYQFRYLWFGELFCTNPAAQLLLLDIAHT